MSDAARRHVVLVGHGSRSAEANASLATLAAGLARDLREPVRPAYLELTTPSIPDALHAALAAGATRITVVPYFLSPGMHVQRDIVEIVAAVRRTTGAVIEIAPFLGAHPDVPRLLAEIAAAPP
jgi:sirohydrochlorin cobaltochelatase